MPPTKSDADLADDFTNFFEDKILTITNMFTGIPQYESTPKALNCPDSHQFLRSKWSL